MTDKAEGAELVELRAEVARLRGALRNVLLLTMQRRPYMPEDVSEKLLRFCREGSEVPSILRMPVDHDADARFAAEKFANPPFRERVPLSLRVRPDSEVSRWVYDEIVRLERERDDLRLRLDDAHDCETHLREALRMANEYAEKLETAMSCPWHPDGKHYCEPCGKSVGEAP